MKLQTSMNSRERILCALNHQEPDHVPLYIMLMGSSSDYEPATGFDFGNLHRYDVRRPYSIAHHIRRAEQLLNLGVDDTLRVEPPLGWAEEYVVEGIKDLKTSIRRRSAEEGTGTVIEKEYHTPQGLLKQTVQVTDDWPHGDNIPVFSDFSVSRSKEHLIKSPDDLEALKVLLGDPKTEEYQRFKEESAELRKAAQRLGVVLEGGRTSLGDSLIWLLGIEAAIMGAYDRIDFLEQLLDLLLEWESKRLELMIDQGIEILFHSAWYEMTDFFTPEVYRRLLKPRLQKLIKLCHEAQVRFAYIMTKSIDIYAEDFLELGMDCVFGVDPVQGGADLQTLKDKFRSRIAVWGGINSAVTLGQGSEQEIEQAVTEAIRILAPGGGFVLYPVDVVLAGANPWSKVKVMLNKWREIGSYPIRV
ncbi:MAG: hypothetical protein JSV89_13395 [Spirochaetaceae bacterium]|nr:MAG: hypothetical protein JSV89_13395 [Spirochaetaceae bacterium]